MSALRRWVLEYRERGHIGVKLWPLVFSRYGTKADAERDALDFLFCRVREGRVIESAELLGYAAATHYPLSLAGIGRGPRLRNNTGPARSRT